MEDEKIVIKNVKVEYISTKTDVYDNEVNYFIMKDKNIETKFAAVIKEGLREPWYKSDSGRYLLKVKTKYSKLKQLHKNETVLVDLCFKHYKMDKYEGFYVSQIA